MSHLIEDLCLFQRRREPQNSNTVWSEGIPELVMEVVSPGFEIRDYSARAEGSVVHTAQANGLGFADELRI